jgi:hypothetical protein
LYNRHPSLVRLIISIADLLILVEKFSTRLIYCEYCRVPDAAVVRMAVVLLALLPTAATAEQVCKLKGIFGHVVEYYCPEFDNRYHI